MNKNRQTSNLTNALNFDVNGNIVLASAPSGSDNSARIPSTAWVRTYVTGLNYITGNQTVTLSGDASGSGTTSITVTLANSGATAGTYGSSTNIPVLTVDAKGRITSVSNTAVNIVSNLAGLSDVTITTAATGQLLQYNGVKWVNWTPNYLTGITSSQVTTALGFTPYNATNPSGYTTNTGTVTSVGGTGTVSGLTLTGSVTTSGNLTLGGTLSLTSANVTNALGYTPYNSTNPSGFITSSGKADGALKLWAASHPNDYYIVNNWTGTYWRLTTNHGSGVQVAYADSAGSASTAGNATSANNADTVDGYHASNFIGKNGNSYYQPDTWIQINGNYGLYAPSYNNAHLYPNDASYGSWRMLGTKNGWAGLHFGGGNGMTLMMNEGEFGFHREGVGWQARFTSGTGYFNISGTAGNTSSISAAIGNSYTWSGIQQFESNNGYYSVNDSNSAKLQAYSSNNNSAFMSFHKGGQYAINMGLDGDNVFRIGGWSASGNRLQMDMSGNLTMAGDVTAYSDARVKTNVTTVDRALEKVLSLRGVYYTRTDSDDKKTKLGVIAQETLAVVPEVVNQDNHGMYNVSYGNFAGLFIEAFKEQQKQIEELKNIIDGLTR